MTEFGRVAERLRIELIHAATPQAKGRVERANQTLQDRLIKEMRLAGVSCIDEAQAFADSFLERWNKRFAVAPRQAEDAHRPWSGSKADLAEALTRREERTAGATRYAVRTQGPGTAPRGAKVTLPHMLDGTLRVRFKDRDLAFTPFKKGRDDVLVTVGPALERAPRFADLLELSLDEQAALDGFETRRPNGRPLGAAEFIAMVEMKLGRKVRPGKRGAWPSTASNGPGPNRWAFAWAEMSGQAASPRSSSRQFPSP